MTDEELIAWLRGAPADGCGNKNRCLDAADRIEALKANTVKLLDDADRDYNCKTNDLIARHAEQVKALVKERDATVALLAKAGDGIRLLARAERLEVALREISNMPDYRLPKPQDIARAALEGGAA